MLHVAPLSLTVIKMMVKMMICSPIFGIRLFVTHKENLIIFCRTGRSHILWYWYYTHAEKPCKAYCVVAMETNLPASLSLRALRFTLEFVLVQSAFQLIRIQMKPHRLDQRSAHLKYIFEDVKLYFLLSESAHFLLWHSVWIQRNVFNWMNF